MTTTSLEFYQDLRNSYLLHLQMLLWLGLSKVFWVSSLQDKANFGWSSFTIEVVMGISASQIHTYLQHYLWHVHVSLTKFRQYHHVIRLPGSFKRKHRTWA